MFGKTVVRISIVGALRICGCILILFGALTTQVKSKTRTTLYSTTGTVGDGSGPGAGQQTLTLNVTANVVPEPSTLALLLVGALGLLGFAWRRQSQAV
jgi:hypothetical protein